MMVEMELFRIIINETKEGQVVVLKEKNNKRTLSIIIGFPEAIAIKTKTHGLTPPRPLTHDLLKNTIEELGANLEKVIIDKLERNTFYAKLILKTNDGNMVLVDARPSDSIALALRADAPIFVEEDVLNKVEAYGEK
jgi:hypothetical protein